jgi:hypothetical protein
MVPSVGTLISRNNDIKLEVKILELVFADVNVWNTVLA